MRHKMILVLLVILLGCIGQDCDPDTDLDGVPDSSDGCPDTPICATVDSSGCPNDSDGDCVDDGCDECPETSEDTVVWGNGCPAQLDEGVPSACMGPDPRAKEIEYSLVNITGATTADIMIKGVVDNIGTEDYLSAQKQQSVQLWEDNVMVAEQEFEDLAVGETVTVEYYRSWSIQGAEFQPSCYQLIVTYDPDILDDGNPDNDDCRAINNSIHRTAAGIATLFD